MNKIKEFFTLLFSDPTPAILYSPVKIPLTQLDRASLEMLYNELDEESRTSVDTKYTWHLDRLLVETGLYSSMKLAREGINSGAVSLNDIKVNDSKLLIDENIWIDPPKERLFQDKIPYLFIRKGKKNYHMVTFV